MKEYYRCYGVFTPKSMQVIRILMNVLLIAFVLCFDMTASADAWLDFHLVAVGCASIISVFAYVLVDEFAFASVVSRKSKDMNYIRASYKGNDAIAKGLKADLILQYAEIFISFVLLGAVVALLAKNYRFDRNGALFTLAMAEGVIDSSFICKMIMRKIRLPWSVLLSCMLVISTFVTTNFITPIIILTQTPNLLGVKILITVFFTVLSFVLAKIVIRVCCNDYNCGFYDDQADRKLRQIEK